MSESFEAALEAAAKEDTRTTAGVDEVRSYKRGARWALNSEVVRGMREALEFSKRELERQLGVSYVKRNYPVIVNALAAFDAAVKGGEK